MQRSVLSTKLKPEDCQMTDFRMSLGLRQSSWSSSTKSWVLPCSTLKFGEGFGHLVLSHQCCFHHDIWITLISGGTHSSNNLLENGLPSPRHQLKPLLVHRKEEKRHSCC